MRIAPLHTWPRTTRPALALQQRLRARLSFEPLAELPRLIAGGDLSYSADGRRALAGIVLWDRLTGAVVETQVAEQACRFPYVPGLLSFRELPALLAAARRLRRRPEAFLCDGQGLAHPRRCGLACHLGLWLELPTIGCAKSRLCGTAQEPGRTRSAAAPLIDAGEIVGVVLRTRTGVRPLYVSPGHRCDLAGAVRLTLACCTRYRLPEPCRLAHRLVQHARECAALRAAGASSQR